MSSHQEDIDLIVSAAIEPLVAFDAEEYDVAFINHKAIDFFGMDSLGMYNLQDFCSRADKFNESSAIALFEALECGQSILHDWPVRLGNVRWLSAYIQRLNQNGKSYIIIAFRDNTQAKESLLKLDNMIAYREMLDQLLAYNTNVNVDEIPQIIDQSLSMVGQYFDCDRSYVFEYSSDLKTKSNINEWCAQGVQPYIDELQNLPLNSFPYLKERLLNMEVVCLDDINDLPDRAIEEREEFAKEGIQSILMIPFSEGDSPIGFIGLDHVHIQKQWTQSEVSNLRLLARTFANLIVRERNEKKIIDNQNLYQTLLDAANDSICIFKGGKCVNSNAKATKEMRASHKQLVGKSVVELSATTQPEGKSPTYLKVYLNEAEKGFPQIFEWRLRRFDGSEFDTEISLNSIRQGNERLVIGILRDVSEHKRVVNALIDSQRSLKKEIDTLVHPFNDSSQVSLLNVFELEQLQKMQDAFAFATGISSLITDVKGQPITKVSFSNHVCTKVRSTAKGLQMCIESGKQLGKLAKEQLKPVSSSCLSCGFIDAAAPIIVDGHHIGNWLIGQVRPNDLSLERLLGYTRSIGLSDFEIVNEFKNLTEVTPVQFEKILNLLNVMTVELSSMGYKNLKLAKTIHQHMQLEMELRNAKQNAEESDRLKSAFLANLSHEIRTPMNGIVGFSELLQYDGLTPDDRREYVRLIHQSSSQLLNIINDIIDISKIESGQIDVHPGYFDLVNLGTDLQAFFSDSVLKKGIELVFEHNDDAEFEVFSDEVKLRQVLTNLISNAIKFTSVGQIRFGYLELNDGALELYVHDSGIGIDTEDVDFIFDRFWQAKDSDVKKGGTGLGLAITKAYVELLGGHIHVESQRDKGTCFKFTIPRNLR